MDDKKVFLSESERIKAKNKKELKGKDKLAHFFNYYTGPLVLVLVIVIIIAITFKQCSSTVDPDSVIMLCGGTHMLDIDAVDAASAELSKLVADANGDGINKVLFLNLPIVQGESSSYSMALEQKRTLEFTVGDSSLLLLSQYEFDGAKDDLDILVPINEYVKNTVFDGYGVYFKDTVLSGNPIYAGIPDDYIFCLRFENPDKKGKKYDSYISTRRASIELLQKIVK